MKKPGVMNNGTACLALVLDDLTGGGAARVATCLANELQAGGHAQVHLVLSDDGCAGSLFPLVEGLCRHHLALRRDSRNVLQALGHNVVHIRTLRRVLVGIRPDLIISFLDRTNVLALLAARGLGVPVIVSERTDPAGRNIGRAWEFLRRLTYPWAEVLVCQGERPLRYFGPRIRCRARIIANPVILPASVAKSRPANGTTAPIVAALGRLGPEKGFDLLLQAFARIAPKWPAWRLEIWGEGRARADLEVLACRLGIEERVRLPGATREPFACLAQAGLFVLSSRVEGFPNALCEAMAVGLPVIATDVGAVPEIIRDGYDGLLVPSGNVEALADAMDRLISDPNERQRLSGCAPEILERFHLERVMGMWKDLIRESTHGARGSF